MLRSSLMILAIICCSLRIPGEVDIDKLVMQAAESQLPVYIAKIQPGHETDFGFTDKDDFENCSVAKPYRIMTFTTDFYDHELTDDVNYVDIKNQWRVPVTLNGEHRVLLTVDGNPGNFTVSGMGGAELAKELEYKSAGMSDSDQYYLLRVFPLSADFFVSEHNHSFVEAEFIPLASARKAIPALGDNKKSYTLEEVQQLVKAELSSKNNKKEPVKKHTTKKHTKKK